MVRSPHLRARSGFTLAETILSMTLMLILIGLSTQLFRKQSAAVSTQSGVLDAQSNSRYALSMIERELRVAGVGVLDAQPLLVQAAPLALTFNADLAANDTGDPGAVYINPDADSATVGVMRSVDRLVLPTSTTAYPDTTYNRGGTPSNAETISYWLTHDSTSTDANEYVLFRRVNAGPVRVVARGLQVAPTDTVFQYFKGDTAGVISPVSPGSLPLVHNATIHGTAADTGKSALTDSIRQVKIRLTSLFRDPRDPAGSAPKKRRLELLVHLMNAGLIHHSTCGNAPLPVTPTATYVAANGTTIPHAYVMLTWSASVDDGGGEHDVQRYGVYRRLSTATDFDQPFTSIPSATPPYSYRDDDLQSLSGRTVIYGVSVQDCTPANSSIGTSASVVIP